MQSSEERTDYTLLNPGSLQELIQALERQEPRDKRTVSYREWKQEYNELLMLYNQRVGFKAYRLLN